MSSLLKTFPLTYTMFEVFDGNSLSSFSKMVALKSTFNYLSNDI